VEKLSMLAVLNLVECIAGGGVLRERKIEAIGKGEMCAGD